MPYWPDFCTHRGQKPSDFRPAFSKKMTLAGGGFTKPNFLTFIVHLKIRLFMTTVALYARISTATGKQDIDNQIGILKEYCQRMDYHIYEQYVDEISGGTSERPAFKKMFADASKRKFDIVLFFSLDRFSREGVRKTVKHLEILESYGVNYKSYTEQYIDSCGIFKDVVIAILAVAANAEKRRISERVLAGLARSKKKNGRPKISIKVITQIKLLKGNGHSNRSIARTLRLSHSTVGLYSKVE
jgi:DNA invertase Pin-like site-specific DNA recombinase